MEVAEKLARTLFGLHDICSLVKPKHCENTARPTYVEHAICGDALGLHL